MSSLEKTIFKNGSTTYYFSSKFFPKSVRGDVFKLYSFVRTADDYVDNVPQNKKEFKILRGLWEDAIDELNFNSEPSALDSINERVVKNMVHLARTYRFDTGWVDAFLDSMQADIDKKQYTSLDGSLWYTYGSAEVIGLMMARILGVADSALPFAAMQGRAMQWINFIRDIDEDTKLGRCYFPREDLDKFDLKDLNEKTVRANTEAFSEFVKFQLARYEKWQNKANQGFKYIPRRLQVPLKTAVENYNWTARQIAKNPLVVYEKQLKPRKSRVILKGLKLVLS